MSTTNGHSNGKPTLKPMGSCHWVDWDSAFIQETMPDPTRVFSILVCTIMFFRYLESADWDVSKLVQGFFLNPYVISFFVIACMTFYKALQKAAAANKGSTLTAAWNALPVYDRWTAEWYFWNAWLFHGVMDGAAGTLQAVPVVLAQYRVMDARFATGHVVPWVVGLVEILIHQPCSLLTLYAVVTKSPYRFPLELITATLHIFGAIVFVAAEVYEGQLNAPALDPIGVEGDRFGNVKWSMYQFTYYWFGFWFCNCVWVWVPLYRIQRAIQECARSFELAESKKGL